MSRSPAGVTSRSKEQRRGGASLVQAIDEAAGIRPLGIAAVLAQDSLHRPERIKKSPAPFIHAATKAMRQLLWEGYALSSPPTGAPRSG